MFLSIVLISICHNSEIIKKEKQNCILSMLFIKMLTANYCFRNLKITITYLLQVLTAE